MKLHPMHYSVTVEVPKSEVLFGAPLEVRYYVSRELANQAAVRARDTLCALLDNEGAEDIEMQETRIDQEDIYAVDYRKGTPYAQESTSPSRIRILVSPASALVEYEVREKLS